MNVSNDARYIVARTAEIATFQSRIVYWQTVLQTGAYKDKNLNVYDEDTKQYREMTDKEKRDHCLSIVLKQIEILEELKDFEYSELRK